MARKNSKAPHRVAIVAGLRTPFCKQSTDFARLSSEDLGSAVVSELVMRSHIDPQQIDALVYGNVVPTIAAPNVAREIVLRCDLPRHIHATTVMRACASSTEATASAANDIALGNANVVIAGGVDCLSDVPILFSRAFADALLKASKARSMPNRLKAFAKIRPKDLTPVPPAIVERSTGKSMGQSAEDMAKLNGISRADQDAFAVRSHQRAAAAIADGRIGAEIAPVYLPAEGRVVEADNHVRPDTSVEALAKLRPVFDKKHGTVTAANACPVTDGASAILMMSEDKAHELGLAPMGFVVAHAFAAVDPEWQLLIAPVFAAAKVLDRAGLSLADMDLVDIHEAFAAQVLSTTRAMASGDFARDHMGRTEPLGEIDDDKLNVMGGSISLGHPFAATACRQMTTVLNELGRRGGRYGLVTQCAAGGMGAAMILERA